MHSKQGTGRRWAAGAAVCCLLLAVYSSGCGGGVRHKIEKGIARAMSEKIGPAKSYNVQVSGPTMALLSGKLSGVSVTGEQVRTRKGITVARLQVDIKDLVVDTDTRAIRKCGGASYSASVSQEELEKYLVRTYPDVPELELELLGDVARVKARPGIAGMNIPISADATLDVKDHRIVTLNLPRADVAGIPTPSFARDYVERKINPILDIADLTAGAGIDSVRIDPGLITIAGTLDLVKAIGRQAPPARVESWNR